MNSIVCPLHNLPLSQVRMSPDKAELICEECTLNLIDTTNKVDFEKIIYLRKAFNCPAYLLSKTQLKEIFPDLFENVHKFDENELKRKCKHLEDKIRAIQNLLEQIVNEIKAHSQFIIENRQEILGKLKQQIHFDQFQQLIGELGNQNDNMNPDIVHQIENKLYQYFQTLQNVNNNNLALQIKELIGAQIVKFENIPQMQQPQMHKQANILVNDFNDNYTKFFIETKPKFEQYFETKFKESKLLQYAYGSTLTQLVEQKSNKKIKQANIIYIGSRDGLNAQQFWAHVNGKSNLLMIFKSKNNDYVFGGYSPCQWQVNSYYGADNMVESFLFSQTHNQIYPIRVKEQSNAIYCDQNQGPVFGSGDDLYFNSDFSGGSSNLGKTYEWNQHQEEFGDHLFGGGEEHIASESEIFQVIFE